MNARSISLSATVESTALPPPPRDSGSGGRPGQGRWKLTLETKWQCKIDEVVILSRARSGLSSGPDEAAAPAGVRRSRRLGARIDAALDEVAAIEEALVRLDDGNFGTCAGCDRPMPAEWLAETPETRYCPDCSLRLVSWQPPSKPKVQAARRTETPAALAEAR